MRILLASYVFYPLLGGITTSSALLAREFAAAGHEVHLITTTAGENPGGENYQIIRNPGLQKLWQEVAWCDVFVSVHLSLRLAWPLAFMRRPWVIAHHSWLTRIDGSIGNIERLKRWMLRHASCISVSRAVADHVSVPSTVIGPPYEDAVFHCDPAIPRAENLLFVGRLVSSKGLDVLLKALAELRRHGQSPGLTVVGNGPELGSAEKLARELGITDEVKFIGPRTGRELREIYCRHRILIVPSITPETFGIVALEGIACGCVVVGSDNAGGLSDAIGPCGMQFKMGDAQLLAQRLTALLANPQQLVALQSRAAEHTRLFTAAHISRQYLDIIEKTVNASKSGAKLLLLLFACLAAVSS